MTELVLLSIFALVHVGFMAFISRTGRLVFLGLGASVIVVGLFAMQMNGPHDPGPVLVAGVGLLLIVAAVAGEILSFVRSAVIRRHEANHGR